MNGFDFLKSLGKPTKVLSETQRLKKTIQYEEYEITLFNSKTRTIFIPLRETVGFETALSNTDMVTDATVKTLLRKFYGVTEL